MLGLPGRPQRDGIGFNLATIDAGLAQKLPEPFDPGYMRALSIMVAGAAGAATDWAQKPTFPLVTRRLIRRVGAYRGALACEVERRRPPPRSGTCS